MSVVAVLSVLFDAKTADLEKGFDRAAKKAHDLGDALSIDDVRGFAAEVASLAGIALTVDAAFDKLASTFQSLDALAKSAQKLGIASAELVGLRHAAGMAGVGAETLDDNLAKMAETSYKAAMGSAEAVRALKELGLEGKELAALPLEQQFYKIAGAMSALKNDTTKLAAAQAIFGNTDLIPLLNQGTSALREQSEEAQRLGIAFNDIELQSVEAANDEMAKLNLAVEGLVGRLAIQLAPVATSVFHDMAEAIAVSNLAIDEQIRQLNEQTSGWNSMTLAWANLADAGALVYESLRLVSMLWTGLNTAIIIGLKEIFKVMSDIAKKASGDNLGLDFAVKNIEKRIGLNAKWMDEQDKAAKQFWQGAFGTSHFERAQQELQRRADSLAKMQERAAAKLKSGKIDIPKFMSPNLDMSDKGDKGAIGREMGPAAPPAALEFGSKEAFSAINAAGGDAGTMVDQQKLTVQGIKSQTEILMEQRRELARIGRWLDGFGGKQVKL